MVYQRKFIKEVSQTAIGVFVLLLATLVAVQAVKLLGNAAGGNVAADAVATLVAFWTVALMPLVLILTAFISALTVLSRYWRDSEMAVWLSSGLSLYGWIKPLMAFAVPFAVLTAVVSMLVMPWADARSREFAEVLKRRQDTSMVRPGVFQEFGGRSPRVYFVEKFDADSGEAVNLFIREQGEDGRDVLITAVRGRFAEQENKRTLELFNGRRYSGVPGQADYDEVSFERLHLIVGTAPKLVQRDVHRRTVPTSQLFGTDQPELRGELMWRFTMPLSVLVLAFLALPLSYMNNRSGRSYSLLIAIGLFLLYQNGLTLVRDGISDGRLPLWFGLSVPHLLMIGLSVLLLRIRSQPAQPFWQAVKQAVKVRRA
ncbi:LPS export ABC transporter permease LptF [Neisseria shayeganii]|uniref:Lipopolysaccharide export system permease protein LptF n=1 Tax=Neisseria shayeganii 871 TaxID=1032488 RepID=G4CJL1_9NEIS|nr:LPS export ABC transporter permease LptF [Neisseria shayeganii]EGY52062.1 YjgP/YjgQ family permease [Neisseria shayeganii 871]